MKPKTQAANGTLPIDKGIAIPASSSKNRLTVNAMELGDSILVDTKEERNTFLTMINRAGFQSISRKEGGKWRVWKTPRK